MFVMRVQRSRAMEDSSLQVETSVWMLLSVISGQSTKDIVRSECIVPIDATPWSVRQPKRAKRNSARRLNREKSSMPLSPPTSACASFIDVASGGKMPPLRLFTSPSMSIVSVTPPIKCAINWWGGMHKQKLTCDPQDNNYGMITAINHLRSRARIKIRIRVRGTR